jgi:hypothetical protein
MTHDYGGRGKRRVDRILMAGGVVMLVVGGVFFVLNWRWDRAKAIALARAWTVAGPPCPSLTPAAAAKLENPPLIAFDDYDDHFARASGAVSCNMIKDDGGRGLEAMPVCKFNSPQTLEIKTAKADVAFGPGLYRGVIVTVRHGMPTCVVVPRERQADMMSEFSAGG